jgi:F-type H+-transporting ATPase subunit delta
MAKLISKTYGNALFELAVEEQKIEVFAEEIKEIMQILKAHTQLQQLMKHPKIVKEEKISILESIFKGNIQDELTGFLVLIITKDRYSEIENILNYFLEQVKALKKIGVCNVVTAVELQQEQKSKVEQKLLDTTDFLSVEMNYQVDQSIIGGMVIRIGDRVVDSSIATKISEMQKELLKIQLQ